MVSIPLWSYFVPVLWWLVLIVSSMWLRIAKETQPLGTSVSMFPERINWGKTRLPRRQHLSVGNLDTVGSEEKAVCSCLLACHLLPQDKTPTASTFQCWFNTSNSLEIFPAFRNTAGWQRCSMSWTKQLSGSQPLHHSQALLVSPAPMVWANLLTSLS